MMYENVINYGGKQVATQPVDPGQYAPDGRPVNQVAYNPQQGQYYDPDYWTREAQRRAIQVSNGQRPDPSNRNPGGVNTARSNWTVDDQGQFHVYDPKAKAWNVFKDANDFYNRGATEGDKAQGEAWWYQDQADAQMRNQQRIKDFDVQQQQQIGAQTTPSVKYAPSFGI